MNLNQKFKPNKLGDDTDDVILFHTLGHVGDGTKNVGENYRNTQSESSVGILELVLVINNIFAHQNAVSNGCNAAEMHYEVGEEHTQIQAEVVVENCSFGIVSPNQNAKENLNTDDEQ